jgi:hypothetical protein
MAREQAPGGDRAETRGLGIFLLEFLDDPLALRLGAAAGIVDEDVAQRKVFDRIIGEAADQDAALGGDIVGDERVDLDAAGRAGLRAPARKAAGRLNA